MLSRLGPVMQIAFVPRDFDAALRHWTRTMGVGPFFLMENVALDNVRYLGKPAEIPFTMALSYWGDVQVELIKPLDDTPSIYRDGLAGGVDGLHHTCVLVEDMDAARAECAETGARILQEADVPGGGAVIYADTGGGPGTILEVLKPSPGAPELFAMLKAAAAVWDGAEPVRNVG